MRVTKEWMYREPAILASMIILSAVLFLFTYLLTSSFHAQQRRLAKRFYSAGGVALNAAKPEAAIEDFRTALKYAPENDTYRFKLAQALASAGRNKEATAHLMNLWESEPGDGEINLELARLAVRNDEVNEALRYFHAAIYGVWNEQPDEHRREARIELARFLLDKRQSGQAESELIALATDLPPSVALHLEVGTLFQQAGDENRALEQFRWVLTQEPDNQTGLLRAGQSCFTLGDYQRAASYLERAGKRGPLPPDAQDMRSLAVLVVRTTPYAPGVSFRERVGRASAAFESAGRRLQECAASQKVALDSTMTPAGSGSADHNDLQRDFLSWLALRPAAKVRELRRNPDELDSVMNLVFQIETDTENVCGTPSGEDRALLLISAARSGGQR